MHLHRIWSLLQIGQGCQTSWKYPLVNILCLPAIWKNMAEKRGRENMAEIIKDLLRDFISFSLISFPVYIPFNFHLCLVSCLFYSPYKYFIFYGNRNSTTALLVERFTLANFTPSILLKTFSTLAEQAEQVIPSTNRVFFQRYLIACLFYGIYKFCYI